ncbi:MAG: CHASE3 domain-containing protein [Opitutaceae bacterium]|jgi:CHASE3 domain sensor protein
MKNSRSVLLSRPLVITGLIASFVLAACTAILSTISVRDIASASVRVNYTQKTLLEINQLLTSLVEAENGQRGYMLTGFDRYLEPYTRANAALDDQVSRLRQRFADAPAQLATLDQIQKLIGIKRKELGDTIALRRSDAMAPALQIMDSDIGVNTMEAVRAGVHEMELRELGTLTHNSASVGRRATVFQVVGLGMLFAACSLGTVGGILLMRRVCELESMITVCSWTKRVKYNGKWVSFEEYLHSRFKLQLTHSISEEAAEKLKLDEVELAEWQRFQSRSPFAKPAPRDPV